MARSKTTFKIGHKHSKEILEKISSSLKGKTSGMKNKHHSEESKLKNSQSHIGQVPWNKGLKMSLETRQKIKQNNAHNKPWLGKKRPDISQLMIGNIRAGIGIDNHNWIPDRSKLAGNEDGQERRSPKYREWRKQICILDNWTCRINNQDCCGRLEVHHILGFKKFPELKYDINNGITLCHFHHPRKRLDEEKLSPYFKKLVAERN